MPARKRNRAYTSKRKVRKMITLNVEFLGMVLWVDHNSADPPLMHVLLLAPDLDPEAVQANGDDGEDGGRCSHGRCATDRHHPRLFYNAAYHTGGDVLSQEFHSISLEDKLLDFSRFQGKLEPVIDGAPDISDVSESRVDPVRLTDEPGDLVTARVTFAAGRGVAEDAAGPWKLHTAEDVAIAHKVRWTVEIDEAQLQDGLFCWELLGLNARGGQPLEPLRPVNGEIKLRVMNVLREELSPHDRKPGALPRKGHRMEHFTPLYAVLANPARRPVPVWRGPEPEEGDVGGGPIGDNYECGTARAQA